MSKLEAFGDGYSENYDLLSAIHKWEDERERLAELYFCILKKVADVNDVQARMLIQNLTSLNLLNNSTLTRDSGAKEISLVKDILVQGGVKPQAADKCINILSKLTKGLVTNY